MFPPVHGDIDTRIFLQVVHMLDGGGAIYKIPLNSALEFGIMYDPNQKRDQALVTTCMYIVRLSTSIVHNDLASVPCLTRF